MLQGDDPTSVLAFHSLSKRSSIPGYRSGFVAGDPLLIAAMKQMRPNLGVTPQAFVQRAAIAAWSDEQHVEETRARYRAKRDVLLPALRGAGLEPVGGPGGFFLWCSVPGDGDDEAFAERLLERGVVVAPGSFFGAGGAGHVRVALVPTLEDCERAAEPRVAARAERERGTQRALRRWGAGLATFSERSGEALDTLYPQAALGAPPFDAQPGTADSTRTARRRSAPRRSRTPPIATPCAACTRLPC